MDPSTQKSASSVLQSIDQGIRTAFDKNRRLLSFEEYLALLGESPQRQLRGSAQYLVDLMDHYGRTEVLPPGLTNRETDSALYRFHLFDEPVDGIAPKVVGQENAQTALYQALRSFARQGHNNKMLLLHGPNGSAKSTLIHALMNAMERYSHEDNGAVYSYTWVFPLERELKGSLGLHQETYSGKEDRLDTFARMPDEAVAARIPCEVRDHPLLLIPRENRLEVLRGVMGKEAAEAAWKRAPVYLTKGDLCHRCRLVFDALMNSHAGDYKRVLKHIQVERFFYSRRYRKGLTTIEPQMHVDAHYHQLTLDKNIGSLPASLQSINFFSVGGDLVDGNRGVVEYSDLLKRPVDAFKYLLTACETGSVNVGSSIIHMDLVMLGSSNELQLDAFKEMPDFSSFKARIRLIRAPYLLSVSQEEEIYRLMVNQIGEDKHVAPHVPWVLALWAVLTRLKKPNSINYPPNVSHVISHLTPIQKARLYDTGEMPAGLSPDERKLLRGNLRRLRDEYVNIPYYEGRMGASVRELKALLQDAANLPDFKCLSPMAVFRQLEDFVKRVSEYDFLKQEVKDGYHDAHEFITVTRDAYLDRVDREVRDAIGLYEVKQWEDFLRRYVSQVSAVIKKEKVRNPNTGLAQDPDKSLIQEFEQIVQAPKGEQELTAFRSNVISQVGAWSLDHPNEEMLYSKVFPDYWQRLEKHYYESQKALLTKMHDALSSYGTERHDANSEGGQLAQKTVRNLQERQGYCQSCAQEVIAFLMQKRY
jgi:predicted Ser/Thr protein kinase